MPKRSLPPQTWLIVAIASYAVAVSLAYLLLLRPLFTQVQRVKATSTAAEEYLVLKNNATKLTAFKEQVEVRNRIAVMRATLDSLAVPSKIRIVSVVPDSATISLDAGFLLRGLRVTVEGNYAQIEMFITAMESTQNYYLLTRLEIVRVNERSGMARLQFTLRMLTVPEQKKESPRRGTGSNAPEPSRTVTAVRNG